MEKHELKILLKQNFGFDEFRPLQQDIIQNILQKKDTFVLMPTGGGKSLCYQLPALYFEGLTVVISPLIALMKDQVDALKLNGIQAERINSSMTGMEIQNVMARAQQGKLKMLYVAPERLAQSSFRQFLMNLNLSLIAIDEAHCISEWGHDFRPDYRSLNQLKELFPTVPITAFTATATPKVQQDILTQLQLRNCQSFVSSFDRPNLKFTVLRKKDTFQKLTHFLEKYKGESVIIYCFSRKDTENLASRLQHSGHKAAPYHAGLKPEQRKQTQDQFIRDDIDIVTATIAFGMGIDKSNIRLVVHYSFPKSIEGYYQEVGRAGRDGLPSECVTFFGYQDRFSQQYFINQITDSTLKKNAERKLQKVMNYCSESHCRRSYLLRYFGEQSIQKSCQNCDNCTGNQEALYFQSTNSNTRQRSAHRRTKTQLPFHDELFQSLRALRKRLADERGVPPYVIFSDATLQEMAYYLPHSPETLTHIQGVGNQKLERFGELFLKEISNFSERTGHSSIEIPTRRERRAQRGRSSNKKKLDHDRYFATKIMLDEGKTIEEVAKAQGYAPSTIFKHVEKLTEGGIKVKVNHLAPDEGRFKIMKWAFEQCGEEYLKPVFEHLKEKYDYDELRMTRLILRQEKLSEQDDVIKF